MNPETLLEQLMGPVGFASFCGLMAYGLLEILKGWKKTGPALASVGGKKGNVWFKRFLAALFGAAIGAACSFVPIIPLSIGAAATYGFLGVMGPVIARGVGKHARTVAMLVVVVATMSGCGGVFAGLTDKPICRHFEIAYDDGPGDLTTVTMTCDQYTLTIPAESLETP